MKKLLITLALFLIAISAAPRTFAQAEAKEDSTTQAENRVYTSPDDVTMDDMNKDIARGKQYFLVLLKRGEGDRTDQAHLDSLQFQHLQRIFYLKSKGKIAVAGPVASDVDLRGIFIFAVETEEEVKALVGEDALIKAGYLVPEIYPWFGISGDKLP